MGRIGDPDPLRKIDAVVLVVAYNAHLGTPALHCRFSGDGMPF